MKSEIEKSLTKAEDHQEKIRKWTVERILPESGILALSGKGGSCKSTLLYKTLAAVTSGKKIPLLKTNSGKGSKVLYVTNEDSLETEIIGRWKEAGGKLKNFRHLPSTETFNLNLNEKDSITQLQIFLEKHPIYRFVVIDPATAYIIGQDAKDEGNIKRILGQLTVLGERMKVLFILVLHFNKPPKESQLKNYDIRYRITGSTAWVDGIRHVLVIEELADDKFILGIAKSNIASEHFCLIFKKEIKNKTVVTLSFLRTYHQKIENFLKNLSITENKNQVEKALEKIREIKTPFCLKENLSILAKRANMKKKIMERIIKDHFETKNIKGNGNKLYVLKEKESPLKWNKALK